VEIWDSKYDEYVYWWYNSKADSEPRFNAKGIPNFDGPYATATSEVEAGHSLGFDEAIVRLLYL
jgi:hypothetical protein